MIPQAREAVSVRFLIGLSSKMDEERARFLNLDAITTQEFVEARQARRRRLAINFLSKEFGFGSFFDGRGIWNGEREDSLMFETIIYRDDAATRTVMRDRAYRLAAALEQEAIGVVFAPVLYEEVRPEPARTYDTDAGDDQC